MCCLSQSTGQILSKSKNESRVGYGVWTPKMSYKRLILTLLALIVALLLLVAEVPEYNLRRLKLLQQGHHLHNCLSSGSSSNSTTTVATACPSYFSWIQHDLSPWQGSGITSELLHQHAKPLADFRVVIIDGKLYMEQYRFCYQTRAQYTLWGILMLLEGYPGLVPDLELMLSCGDRPQVLKKNYRSPPPPLFSYCTTRNDHFDIVFPDWSFWGWPEVNIAPWSLERENIFFGAQKVDWMDRKPVAQWRGNTFMGKVRPKLLKCNPSTFSVTHQDWGSEIEKNFSSSSLSDQCSYRYKAYVEGIGWSVSLKYIMSCGSTMLVTEPKYFEFYSRSLLPYLHFWPVNKNNICTSVQRAVQWGNDFPAEAEAVGKCSHKFLSEQLTMEHIYQYMIHLLQSYAKLLKFKPVPPPGVEPMTLNSSLQWHEVTMPDKLTVVGLKSLCNIV